MVGTVKYTGLLNCNNYQRKKFYSTGSKKNAMTLSIMTFSITTLSIMTFSITINRNATLSVMTDIQNNGRELLY